VWDYATVSEAGAAVDGGAAMTREAQLRRVIELLEEAKTLALARDERGIAELIQ
jgi:hypothetical protein